MAEGQWIEPYEMKGRLWQLKCGPVFSAQITYGWQADRSGYAPSLNGEQMGFYGDLDKAKARIEWEIWNRVRQMTPAYRAIMDRRVLWENGSG